MAGFTAPTGPLKVAGLVNFKKPKTTTPTPGPTAPIDMGSFVLGGAPTPTVPAPTASTGAFNPNPSVPDLLGGPSQVTQANATPVTPSPSVSGLFSEPTVLGSLPAVTPAATPQLAPDGHVMTAAEIADRARAQGAGAGAADSLGANTATGQAQQSTQAGAMATASNIGAAALNPNDPNVIRDPATGQLRRLTDAEISDRARAQGAGAGAAASLAANETAGKQAQSTQANAMASASAAAAKPAAAPTPAAPAGPPAAGSTQADLDTLRTTAVNAMNAKDDPVATREFNQAILKMGMANQAQRDALKMQIAQDPALNGQPAGTAVLMAAAQAAGGQVDNLIASLSIESAKRIQDLNQWGFDKLSSITDTRINQAKDARTEMLNAGDYDGYAKAFKDATGMDVDVKALKSLSPATQTAIENLSAAMNRNVAAGNMDAAKRNFAAIQALSPEAFGTLTFDDVITAPDAYKAHSDQQAGLWSTVRTQATSGQTADALAGLDAIFPDKAKQQTDGDAAVASNDLNTINAALKAAGMSPVTDKSELIGRGSDVFKAMQLATIQKEAGSTAVDKGVETLQTELQKLGYDPTKPEEATALRSYVLSLQLNGGLKVDASGNIQLDPNSLIPPWDPKSPDAHLFSDWPVLAADETTVIDKGGEPYGTSNPKPSPDSARGQYYAKLDAGWEDYLAKTSPADRLTRDQWFYATKAATQAPDPTVIPAGIKPAAPDASDPATFDSILQNVRAGKTLTSDQESSLVTSGRLTKMAPADLIKSDLSQLANQNDGLVVINGHVVQVKPGGFVNQNTESVNGSPVEHKLIPVTINGKDYMMDERGYFYGAQKQLAKDTDISLKPRVDPWAAPVPSLPSMDGPLGSLAGISFAGVGG
jgi:hypothetical protein